VPILPVAQIDADLAVAGHVEWPDGTALICTTRRGLFRFDGQRLEPLPTPAILRTNRANALCAVFGGYYAIAVEGFGLLFLDRDLRVVQTLDRHNDHRLARIRRLVLGREGDLWAVLGAGLARIEFPSPVSHMEPFVDSGFNYVQLARHREELWLCADGVPMRGHYDADGRVYSSRGYEVALAKLAWFEDREQKRKEMPVCGLCQRHQKLETVDGTAFWLEYGEDGRPRLVMDSTARGGGLNVLCTEFCPMCGRFCGKLEAEHEEK
jgi:hypothetical protein